MEALCTVICEIEVVVNCRPLFPISSDISHFEYMTPSHFIIGIAMMCYPELDVTATPINRLKFRQISTSNKISGSLGQDYLIRLQSRPEWRDSHPNMKEGDLVIVRSENIAPLTWQRPDLLRQSLDQMVE